MSSSWTSLHHDLVASIRTLRFQRRFERIRSAAPALSPFPDPAALLDRLHAPGREPEARNDLLRALASASRADPETATTLLLLALWPGLDGVRRRLTRAYAGRSDELAAEITGRATEILATLNLDQVTWIAATAIRNVERDLRRDLARVAARARAQDPMDVAEMAAGEDPTVAVFLRQVEQLAGRDAELVMRVAIGGESQVEAGRRLRLGPEAARKRCRRALQRLRRRLEDAA